MRLTATLRNNWRYLPETVNVPLMLGFACVLSWMSAFYTTVPDTVSGTSMSGSASFDVYLASLFVSALVDLAFVLFPQATLSVLMAAGALPFATIMALAALLIALPGIFGFSSVALIAAGAVLAGAASALLLLCYALALGRLTMKMLIGTVVLTYILSTCIGIVLPLSNMLTITGLSVVLPLVSVLCLRLGQKANEHIAYERYKIEEPSPGREFPYSMLGKLCAMFAIWSATNRLLRRLLNDTIGLESSATFALAHASASVAITLIVAGTMTVLLALPQRFRFEHVYRIFFLFGLLSILLLPFAVAGEGFALLTYACNTAGYQVFCLFMWVIIAALCRNYASNALRSFGLLGFCWSLGAAGGVLTGNALASSEAALTLSAIVLASTMIISVCYTFVFTERDAHELARIIPSRHKRPFRDRCAAVAKRFGLTARETEVFMLVAQGRDSGFIQEKLVLSRSTVQTHRAHIYQKLGIHNKQELIDLVEKQEVEMN